MPTGGKLTIETANATLDAAGMAGARSGQYISIAIRDEGTGMSEEVLARAFDPYFTTKDSTPLSGLGLSRVYGFVRQSGGHLRIDTEAGRGTTITLYLPRLLEGEPAIDDVAQPNVVVFGAKPAKGRSALRLQGLRVLVVEDESLIGMLAEDLLEQLGCRMVGLVSSLDKALEMAKRAEIDFALLDVDLGGEPVYPVARALQARSIAFAFMSGYGGLEGDWREWPVIQKPFDLAQLRREIERAISA
jgi:CheY-like chemotaxis protein